MSWLWSSRVTFAVVPHLDMPKVMPWVSAQSEHVSRSACRCLGEVACRSTSSQKRMISGKWVGGPGAIAEASLSMKMLNKSGDSTDPWNRPDVRCIVLSGGSCEPLMIKSLVVSWNIRLYMRLCSRVGQPLSDRSRMRTECGTLSNAPLMSKKHG